MRPCHSGRPGTVQAPSPQSKDMPVLWAHQALLPQAWSCLGTRHHCRCPSVIAAGLGLFEYMQLAEELGAEAVWVINNGVAHADSVPTSAIQPYVQVLQVAVAGRHPPRRLQTTWAFEL